MPPFLPLTGAPLLPASPDLASDEPPQPAAARASAASSAHPCPCTHAPIVGTRASLFKKWAEPVWCVGEAADTGERRVTGCRSCYLITRVLPARLARVRDPREDEEHQRPHRPEVAGAGERPDRDEQDRQRDERRWAVLMARPRAGAAADSGRSAVRTARSARVRAANAFPMRSSSSSESSRPAPACVRRTSTAPSRSASEARMCGASGVRGASVRGSGADGPRHSWLWRWW